jgi:hypothetical protein
MKRSITTMIGAGVLSLAFACGSKGGSGGGDPNARFACIQLTSDGMTCTDYTGGAATTDVRDICTQAGGTITEGALCPTDGVGGICSFAEGGGMSRVVYYNLQSDQIPQLQTGCTGAGGTWSAS